MRRSRTAYGTSDRSNLRREQIPVPRCTVERLIRAEGRQGLVRGRPVRSTIPAMRQRSVCVISSSAPSPRAAQNQLWITDFTYVATWRRMVYVAFVIDIYSRRLVGWRASASMRTEPRSTRASMPCTTGKRTRASCITVIASRSPDSTGRRDTNAWSLPASRHLSEAAATRSTTRLSNRCSACARPM